MLVVATVKAHSYILGINYQMKTFCRKFVNYLAALKMDKMLFQQQIKLS